METQSRQEKPTRKSQSPGCRYWAPAGPAQGSGYELQHTFPKNPGT